MSEVIFFPSDDFRESLETSDRRTGQCGRCLSVACEIAVSGKTTFERSSPFEMFDCYQRIAIACGRENISRLLIVTTDGDPTDRSEMSSARSALKVVGLRPLFKLAMVASSNATFAIYRDAETEAASLAIDARAFRDVTAAVALAARLRWVYWQGAAIGVEAARHP